MNDLRAMLERIKARVGANDPERLALAVRVAMDAAALQARALSGEDVAGELAIVEATARNLDDLARQAIGAELLAFATNVLARALGVALAG